jgi:hypothetical protein
MNEKSNVHKIWLKVFHYFSFFVAFLKTSINGTNQGMGKWGIER